MTSIFLKILIRKIALNWLSSLQGSKLKKKKKEREGILKKDNNQEKDRTFWALANGFHLYPREWALQELDLFCDITNPITGNFYDGVKELSRNAEQVVYSLSVFNLIIYIIFK